MLALVNPFSLILCITVPYCWGAHLGGNNVITKQYAAPFS